MNEEHIDMTESEMIEVLKSIIKYNFTGEDPTTFLKVYLWIFAESAMAWEVIKGIRGLPFNTKDYYIDQLNKFFDEVEINPS